MCVCNVIQSYSLSWAVPYAAVTQYTHTQMPDTNARKWGKEKEKKSVWKEPENEGEKLFRETEEKE